MKSTVYINNPSNCFCVGSEDTVTDKITVSHDVNIFTDCETGKEYYWYSGMDLIPGRMYRANGKWALRRGFDVIKLFDSEEEAKAAYRKVIEQIARDNTVIDV